NLTVPSIGPVTATVAVSASASPSPGTFTLTITGTSASGATRSFNIAVVIAGNFDFTASASPQSLALIASSTKTSQISLQSAIVVSGIVALTAAWRGAAPAGTSFSLAPTSLTVPSTGRVSATLTVSNSASPSPGTFPVRITATSTNGVTRSFNIPIVLTNNLS